MSEPGAKFGQPLVRRDPTDLTEGIILEMKNGLPVIAEKEYERIMHTDMRKAGGETVATIDFRGYVRTADGDCYRDTLTTNGILRDGAQSGMYLETSGVGRGHVQWLIDGQPDQIKHYELFLGIPAALQRQLKIVVSDNGRCRSEEEFLEFSSRDEMETARNKEYALHIVLGYHRVMSLDPLQQGDSLARQKAELIHDQVVNKLLAGISPLQLEAAVDAIETTLRQATAEEMNRQLAAQKRP